MCCRRIPAQKIYIFRELVKSLMLADANTDKQELFRQILRSAFGDVEEGRQVFVQILLLTAACAFLQNFINVFENSQISKTGFYLYFLLLMGLLLRSYLLIHGILEGVLDQVISFMEALLPAFCMTMVFCSQQVAAVGFYQLSLIVIYFDRACAVVCGDPGDSCVCGVTDVELYDGGKADFTNDGVIEAGIDLGDASVAGGSDRHECDRADDRSVCGQSEKNVCDADHQHDTGTGKYSAGSWKYFFWLRGSNTKRNRNSGDDCVIVSGDWTTAKNADIFGVL